MFIGFRLEYNSVTLSDLEYEGATVGYCRLFWLFVWFAYLVIWCELSCCSLLYSFLFFFCPVLCVFKLWTLSEINVLEGQIVCVIDPDPLINSLSSDEIFITLDLSTCNWVACWSDVMFVVLSSKWQTDADTCLWLSLIHIWRCRRRG